MPAAFPSPKGVASVTVALNPDPARLQCQVDALAGQVEHVIVVDNGSDAPLPVTVAPAGMRRQVLRLTANQGIARGLNVGIEAAARAGATHVLLLDQDSVPAPGMVAALRATLDGKRSEGVAVAAVGPRICDTRDHRELPFIRLGWLRNRHVRAQSANDVIACDFLITSGTLIPLEAYRKLGPFDEDLFIDNVDLEWCFRARSQGFRLYGVAQAGLDHELGDARVNLGRRVRLVVHSPERVYYMTRNRLLLYRRPYMPLKWKLKDALRIVGKFAATMAFVAPRGEYARMTWRGVSDALQQRGGKLEA